MNQEEVCLGIRKCLSHSLDEVDHGDGIGREGLQDLAMQGSATASLMAPRSEKVE